MSMLQFSEAYYLNNNPDVLQAVLSGDFPNGLAHYNQYGWAEGRDPNPYFDTSYYLQNNGDVLQAVISGDFINPLQHFLMFGSVEGRAPSAELAPLVAAFDEAAYRAANPDVDAAIDAGDFQSAMQHWLLYGQFENRPGVPFIGQDFTLTTGTDNFTGGDGNDTFNAPLDLAIDGLVGAQTLQGPDMLNGGGGVNTLNAELNGTGTTANPTINNIQIYNLTSFAGLLGFGNGELDLDRASGYEQLWNRNSRVDLELYNVGEVAVLGMDNVRNGSTYEVNYDNIAVETQTVVATRSGAEGNRVELEINGVLGGDITNLELIVSNGVYLRLDNDAADMDNLIISGSGILDLVGEDNFDFLQSLDSTLYDGDLDIDVSGSAILTSVLTGPGDDRVVVNNAAVNGDLAVDMGLGMNTLALSGVEDRDDVEALDFTGGVVNVQTLQFVDDINIAGGVEYATLDLDGISDLEVLSFANLASDGWRGLTLDAAPVDLMISAESMATFGINAGDVENLGIDVVNDISLDLQGASLVTADVNAGGNVSLWVASAIIHPIAGAEASDLETLNVAAGVNANVSLGTDGPTNQLTSLREVNVSGGQNATLSMTGIAGTAAIVGVRQVEQFVVDVGNAGLQEGQIIFSSGDLTGGAIVTDYSENGGFLAPTRDNGSARDIALDLNASPDLIATFPNILGFPTGNTVTVEWADFGPQQQLFILSTNVTSGSLFSPLEGSTTTLIQAGVAPEAMVEGEGFEALETVAVNAEDGDATVNLTDVYGAFFLDVSATDNAVVFLTNTNVTSATVAAGMDIGDTATVTVGGDTIGAWSLVDLTVSGDVANVTLADDLDSFTTLDVSGVATNLTVNTSGADFSVAGTQFITYLIGATSDGDDSIVDVAFTGNVVREVYEFVGGDIGEIEITAFTSGADPMTGDRLDLSHLGVNSSGELIFTDLGGDLVITSLGNQDFTGSITLVGLAGDGADVSSFNIIYA